MVLRLLTKRPSTITLGVMSNKVGQGSSPNFRCSAKTAVGAPPSPRQQCGRLLTVAVQGRYMSDSIPYELPCYNELLAICSDSGRLSCRRLCGQPKLLAICIVDTRQGLYGFGLKCTALNYLTPFSTLFQYLASRLRSKQHNTYLSA